MTSPLRRRRLTMAEAEAALEQVRWATSEMDGYRRVIGGLAAMRRKALRELADDGVGVTTIARYLGISRQQVYRLLRDTEETP